MNISSTSILLVLLFISKISALTTLAGRWKPQVQTISPGWKNTLTNADDLHVEKHPVTGEADSHGRKQSLAGTVESPKQDDSTTKWEMMRMKVRLFCIVNPSSFLCKT